MLSVLGTAWRVVVKRSAADWLILTAALITILLATTLLAAGPIYADAVTLSGSQRTLADAPPADANVEISLRVPAEKYAANDETVARVVPDAFALTGGTIRRRLAAESYELPSSDTSGFTDLAAIQHLGGIAEHASIVAGTWPEPGGEPYQTVVPDTAARRLGLDVGSRLTVVDRFDRSGVVDIVIVGIYRIDDASDPYWYEDALALDGVVEGGTFRTFGPFVVDIATLLTGFAPSSAVAGWRVFPDFDNLEIGEIGELRRRVQELESQLNAGQEVGLAFEVGTRLDRILTETERSLLSTRSGVLTLAVQLAILAGYALLLTAGLLVESRRVETSLLRSRGGGSRQVLAMALMEGFVLTVPAALIAPWLAAAALRTFNGLGPLASIELTIDPVVTPAAYVLALLAAAGCTVALAVPAYRSARTFTESYVARGREDVRRLLHRGGVDVALLVLAAIALWQLRRYGAPITSTVQGRLGIDPLLVAAPTLGLLAGAILALRTLPLVARIAERATTAGPAVVRALAAWQVARRPARHSRSVLLLVMAISIGLFAAAYTTTWKRSQEDQADHQIGADLRVVPDQRIGASIPELNLQDAHEQLDALGQSMPVVRISGVLTRTAGSGRFVVLDAARAAEVVRIRPDLPDVPFAELMAELVSRRPSLATVGLPGEPRHLALDISVAVEPLEEDVLEALLSQVPESRLAFNPRARAVIQDGSGLLHRIDLGAIPVDAGTTRLSAELSHTMRNGEVAAPDYPLAIVEIEIEAPAPAAVTRNATIELAGVYVSETPGTPAWQPVAASLSPDDWRPAATRLASAFRNPTITYSSPQPEQGLGVAVESGVGGGPVALPVYFGLRPVGTVLPETYPAVVSAGFLELSEGAVGDEFRLDALRVDAAVAEVIGVVTSFPTVSPQFGEAIVVDLPTIQMLGHETGARIATVGERWLHVAGDETAATAERLRDEPYASRLVLERDDRAEALQSDPVALGTIGSLALGFVAAAVFAAVGFSVSAVVSARERITEFALLRAVGLSTRQLARWLALEHGALVVGGLLLGSVIGLLLSWLILPLIAITQEATVAVPDVLVVYPWTAIVRLQLAVVVVLGLIVGVLAAFLRRIGLGSLLRLGED